MLSDYTKLFNDANLTNQNIAASLKTTLKCYLQENFPCDDNGEEKEINKDINIDAAQLKAELDTFLIHLDSAKVGKIIINYDFKYTLPKEIKALFNIVKLVETSRLQSPSSLVSECENIVAAEYKSPKSIFTQIVRLETALVNKNVPEYHINEVRNKVDEWFVLLHEKFATLILESKDLSAFKESLANSFSKERSKGLEIISEFLGMIDTHFNYMKSNKFFEKFYGIELLSDKAMYVAEFYAAFKKSDSYNGNGRAILLGLYHQIVDLAYEPLEREKNKLMRDPQATLKSVFTALDAWAKQEWKPYEESPLTDELNQRFNEQVNYYKCWEYLKDRTTKGATPLYQLHSMKYCGNPRHNPKDILHAMGLSLPEKKQKSTQIEKAEYENEEVVVDNSPETSSTKDCLKKSNAISLVCEETIKDDNAGSLGKKHKI